MEALIVFGGIIVIIIWGFIAAEFRRIAAMKGHPEARYFWWTFLTGPAGMLMVIALPQKIEFPVISAPTPAPVIQTPPSKADDDRLPDI